MNYNNKLPKKRVINYYPFSHTNIIQNSIIQNQLYYPNNLYNNTSYNPNQILLQGSINDNQINRHNEKSLFIGEILLLFLLLLIIIVIKIYQIFLILIIIREI